MLVFRPLRGAVLGTGLGLLLGGCASAPPKPPPCAEFRQVYLAAAQDDFSSIRSKVETRSDRSIYRLYDTTLKLSGADSCVIREHRLDFEHYCRWEAQSDDDKLVATHEAVRQQIVSCLKEAEVSRMGESVRVRVVGKDYGVEFHLASRRFSTNYVTLAVRRFVP
jgi:hypothetical protein